MASTKASRYAPSSRCFRRNEALDFPLHAEPRALALQQRLERRLVMHPFVDFHVGRRVVAAAHPAPAHAAALFDEIEQGMHAKANLVFPSRSDLVVDVIVQIGTTASSSPPALSTTTPPL